MHLLLILLLVLVIAAGVTTIAHLVLRWHLIDGWRSALGLWSVRLAALGSAALTVLAAFPDAWAALPPEARALLPHRLQALGPLLILLATLYARLVRQPGAKGGDA